MHFIGRQLQTVHEFDGIFSAAFDGERNDAARSERQIFIRQFVVLVSF